MIGDNTLIFNKVALIAGIMEKYDIDVMKIITRKIQDKVVSTDSPWVFYVW